jgi:hypothetical protein
MLSGSEVLDLPSQQAAGIKHADPPVSCGSASHRAPPDPKTPATTAPAQGIGVVVQRRGT